MHKYLQVYCCVKNPQSHVLVHFPCFESVLHGEIGGNFTMVPTARTLNLHIQLPFKVCCMTIPTGPLKLKYLVNAENLKRILKRHPLINLKKY